MASVAEKLTPIVEYSVSDAAIEQLKDKFTGLTCETPTKYREVVEAIGECRDLRVRVEKTRVELKAGALEYGRKVDSEAKRITAMLFGIEEPLKIQRQAVDDEKDRARREKEQAERDRIEAELKVKREAEEAAAKAERDRIRAEQEAEDKRLAGERAKLAEERAAAEAERKAAEAKMNAERQAAEAKLAEERKAIDAERQRLEREEFQRQANERAEWEARDKAERAAAAKRAAEERAAEVAERLAELRPDMEKLSEFAKQLKAMTGPHVTSSEAMHALDRTLATIHEQASVLLVYCLNNSDAKLPNLIGVGTDEEESE